MGIALGVSLIACAIGIGVAAYLVYRYRKAHGINSNQ